MVIKKRIKTADNAEINRLADAMADRPYGDEREKPANSNLEIINKSISLNRGLIYEIEDLAVKNKRTGDGPNSFSGIVKEALKAYIKN